MRRIIGCGNVDRGDDGAGILAAHTLISLGVSAVEVSGDMLDLIDHWEGADEIILIDAVVTGAPRGTIQCWNAENAAIEPAIFHGSTHSFGVAEAIELARVLGKLPSCLIVYGIEARNFEPGAAPSAEIVRAVRDVAHLIAALP